MLVLLGRAQMLSSRSFRGAVIQGGGEMGFRAICVALLLASLPFAGCGTMANLANSRPDEGGRSTFGGVRQDVACIKKASNGEFGFRTHTNSESEQYPQVALMLFCAVDLPFSLIGDVVTWPYTMAYTLVDQPIPTPPVMLSNTPVTPAIPTAPMTAAIPIPPVPQPGQLKTSP